MITLIITNKNIQFFCMSVHAAVERLCRHATHLCGNYMMNDKKKSSVYIYTYLNYWYITSKPLEQPELSTIDIMLWLNTDYNIFTHAMRKHQFEWPEPAKPPERIIINTNQFTFKQKLIIWTNFTLSGEYYEFGIVDDVEELMKWMTISDTEHEKRMKDDLKDRPISYYKPNWGAFI